MGLTNSEKCKRWREKNKEIHNKKRREAVALNRDEYRRKANEWYHKNKDKANKSQRKYKAKKRKNDMLYKLTENLRSSIGNSFRNKNFKKGGKTEEILGCTYIEFKLYLESKFEAWMSWDNHGLYNGDRYYGWDIDHIIPLSTAKTKDEIIKLNHYTNLQPLCSYKNRVNKNWYVT